MNLRIVVGGQKPKNVTKQRKSPIYMFKIGTPPQGSNPESPAP